MRFIVEALIKGLCRTIIQVVKGYKLLTPQCIGSVCLLHWVEHRHVMMKCVWGINFRKYKYNFSGAA
jgi:hypothetical protein